MNYATTDPNLPVPTRKQIAQGIARGQAALIAGSVASGEVVHIRDIAAGRKYFCIYCLDRVDPTSSRQGGANPVGPWHFQHCTNSQCLGKPVLGPGHVNPRRHGCYLMLGNLALHPVSSCNCRSYCHHFAKGNCP